jgi:hypothetical protein
MRVLVAAFVLLAAASAAAAQSRGHGLTDEMPTPSIGLPLPQIGLPLPSIGLPLEPMGLPPARRAQPEQFQPPGRFERPDPFDRSDRSGRSERLRRSPSIVVFGWPYLPVGQFPAIPSAPTPAERASGRLRLLLTSGVNPQLFVDGYYTGLFSDRAGELTLDPGPHTIELREEGYNSARVQVNIQPNAVLTYDIGLPPLVSAPLPAAAQLREPASPAPAPSTIYVVPGCYVGNVPPTRVALPAGCDAAKAVEFPSR